MGKRMAKRELVDELSDRAFTTRKQACAIIENLIEIASREAVNGFSIPGLCKFEVVDRKARKGRNPQTGESIDIPATKSLRIRPSARLKRSATAWIPSETNTSAREESPAIHSEAQSFFIECPHCERKLEADSDMCGLVAECPYCENSITIPQMDASNESGDSTNKAENDDE